MTVWTNAFSASLLNRTVGRALVDTDRLEELERAKAQLQIMTRDVSRLYRRQREQSEELARVTAELRSSYLSMVETLAFVVEAKDEYTRNHLERCRKYGLMLARRIDPGLATDEIEYGFLLHDVGKLGIPDSILSKPGALTSDEMRLVETHPIYGLEIVAPLKGLLGSATSVIRHHHERYDGSGYPDGLAGDEISVAARLFSVVDAFDAMTSDRPYRPALSFEEAIRRLHSEAGRQFDPAVVEVFAELVA
jgi:HD-GYP domain-containing protein (c-di-GMP phosphodiesterase class II)